MYIVRIEMFVVLRIKNNLYDIPLQLFAPQKLHHSATFVKSIRMQLTAEN